VNKEKVYLAQTDTTVGFLSSDDKKLSSIKQRSSSQKMLQIVDRFTTLKQQLRIPKKFKKLVRNSKKTTFIYANGNSYRVIDKNFPHHSFIMKFGIMYSTSANITQNKFDKQYALNNCDISVEDNQNFFESTPSKIYKINNIKMQRIR